MTSTNIEQVDHQGVQKVHLDGLHYFSHTTSVRTKNFLKRDLKSTCRQNQFQMVIVVSQ